MKLFVFRFVLLCWVCIAQSAWAQTDSHPKQFCVELLLERGPASLVIEREPVEQILSKRTIEEGFARNIKIKGRLNRRQEEARNGVAMDFGVRRVVGIEKFGSALFPRRPNSWQEPATSFLMGIAPGRILFSASGSKSGSS